MTERAEATGLFGFGDNTPLTAHYRVAVDIDATPSRGWSGGGFRPIGRLDIINDLSAAPAGDLFQGVLNGDGHQIRGLSVDMTNASAIQHVGIFSGIGASGKVVSLQLSDLFVRGGSGATGGLAGISEGLVSLVGGAGVVQGGSQPNVRVGGLVGWSRNSVVESWFVGEVKGDQSGSAAGQGIGGLIGRVMRGGDSITIRNNWAQARVEDTNPTGTGYVGGLIGHFSGVFQNGWSGGEVVGPGSSSRGLIGILVNASSSGGGGFLDRSTSGSTRPFIASAVSARGVATMLTVSSGLSNAWNYGGATDYPFLSRYETMRPGAQALAYADAQTRILSTGGDEFLSGGRMELAPGENPILTLDTNGIATGAPAPVPTCAADSDGVIVAKTNYNDVTVRLQTTGDGSAVFTTDCKIMIIVAGRDVLVEALIATGEATISSWSYLFARDSSVTFPLEFEAVSSPVSVAAAAGINAKVLTVSLREGATPSFNDAADANFKAAGGGVQATVSLARAATAIFASDNATLDFVVTASDNIAGSIDTQALMVQFVSEPRAISAEERLDVILNVGETDGGSAIVVTEEQAASIAIWHHNAPEQYNLSQTGNNFFVHPLGEVNARDRLAVGFYNFTLQLTGGGETASLPVRLRVIAGGPAINAPAGPVIVPADAGASGDDVLVATIPLLGMGAIAATTNGDLQTGGGDDGALVTLTRAAADAFASDNLTLSLVLQASGPDGSDTATIRFVSAPRAIDKEELLLSVFLIEATVGAEILAGGASQLSIWHNGDGDSEVYSLEQAVENFGFDPATGLVTAAVSLAEDVYPITLHLNDGDDLRATRVLRVSVFENPARAALRIFLEEIAAGDFDWFAARNAENPAYDWDGDDIANPYDWTPTSVTVMVNGAQVEVGVNLTLNGVDPWPVYNIWQLQAIDGVVPAETTARFSSDADAASASQTAGQNLFGTNNRAARLDENYRLAVDIDAAPTRNWDDGSGFRPLGSATNNPVAFGGAFDGGGNVVRGLHINRPGQSGIGLFALISRRNPSNPLSRVVNLGLDDVRITGRDRVGAIVGVINAASEARALWARGRVRGEFFVGGLIGSSDNGNLSDSWFAGQVAGDNAVGGLSGHATFLNLEDSWAAVDIVAPADAPAGELVGQDEGNPSLRRLWGEGYLSTNSRASIGNAQSTYYDNIRERNAAAFGSAPIWNVGSVGADGDFPTLTVHSAATQGAAIAYGLTRASVVGGRVLSEEDPTLVSDLSPTIVFDRNGDAADRACVAGANGAIATGYNDATVRVSLPTGAVAAAGGVCGYVLTGFDSGAMTLTVSFASGGDSIAREYPMQINDVQAFLAEIETADDWFSAARIVAGVGSAGDWDGDGIANVYDWTPIPGVNLTSHLIGAGGAAENPWPIYNIWQLQAIDGVVPADATMGLSSQAASASQTAGENLYGADSNARLGANYLLALDIDATPTRNWDDGSGFDPIGAFSVGSRFGGLFDGGGNIVRGLHIDRASNNIGLFAAVAGGAEWVVNLGLDDARITGGNSVGAIAGVVVQTSEARAVWARGRVRGGDNVGGLIGASSGGILSEGWFAGRVEGNNSVGGLVGEASFSPDLIDSWAAVDIVAPAGARAGELVGNGNSFGISNLTRMWGEGYLSAADFLASGANLSFVHTDNIRALDDDDFDDAPAWNVGSVGADGDFPTLTVHSAATQGAAIAYGLTRISLVGGRVLSEEDPTLVSDLSPTIVFDRNGDAADRACVAGANGAIATGYNDATVRVSLPTGAVAAAGGVCGYVLTGFDSGEMTLTVSFASGGDSIAREYPMQIDETRAFVAKIAADGFDWFSPDLVVAPDGTPTDWDGDGVDNPYDWTPLPAVDLLIDLTDPGSSASNPWPIYNVWQLQAIDGVSVSQDGSIGSSALFGGESDRLGANYRLQMDIDATPTRGWDGGKGFNPIGFSHTTDTSALEIFRGVFDGGGNVVRGLRINRGSSFHNGLFAVVSGRVTRLGLDDVFVLAETE